MEETQAYVALTIAVILARGLATVALPVRSEYSGTFQSSILRFCRCHIPFNEDKGSAANRGLED
jgi:hypothetical protein